MGMARTGISSQNEEESKHLTNTMDCNIYMLFFF